MDQQDAEIDRLLNHAATGDQQAIHLLLERHRTRLKRMAAAYLDDRLLARLDPSDVVQKVFLEAAQKVRNFAQDRPISFYPWLRQIACQRLRKLHEHHFAQKRSVARERPGELELSTYSLAQLWDQFGKRGCSPNEQVVFAGRNTMLREHLGRLWASDRSLLLLRYVDCAEILGIRHDAFSKRHLRALLRELLQPFTEELT